MSFLDAWLLDRIGEKKKRVRWLYLFSHSGDKSDHETEVESYDDMSDLNWIPVSAHVWNTGYGQTKDCGWLVWSVEFEGEMLVATNSTTTCKQSF